MSGWVLAAGVGISAGAQCVPAWRSAGGHPGCPDPVGVWNPNGPGEAGEALVLAGASRPAGDDVVHGVALLDPRSGHVTPLGAGVDSWVIEAATGRRGELYIAGRLAAVGGVAVTNIACFRGGVWEPLGEGLGVPGQRSEHLLVLPAGDLVAAGTFQSAGGGPARHIARWDGRAWAALGSGLNAPPTGLERMPSGSMLAVGPFTEAGGVSVRNLAVWSVVGGWSALPEAGLDLLQSAEAATVDGHGRPVVAGVFRRWVDPPRRLIRAYDAAARQWVTLGGEVDAAVVDLRTMRDGRVLALGAFTAIGAAATPYAAVWDGSEWSPYAPGLLPPAARVFEVAGDEVLLGASDGRRQVLGVGVRSDEGWDPVAWGLAPPPGSLSPALRVLCSTPDGGVLATGDVTAGGAAPGGRVLRWNGARWRALGSGPARGAEALAVLSDGSVLAGGGEMTLDGSVARGLARWDGSAWAEYGGGVEGVVSAIVPLPDGRVLVGGDFQRAAGHAIRGPAIWEGDSWTALGSGIVGQVFTLAVAADGSVLAGGRFAEAGGVAAQSIARWDGHAWSPLAAGLDGEVRAILILPDGDIVAAGQFARSGPGRPGSLNSVARFHAGAWQSMGSGISGRNSSALAVNAAVLDREGRVVIGGAFETADGRPAARLARWDGTTWEPLASSVEQGPTSERSAVRALAVTARGDLVAAGNFAGVDSVVSPFMAWRPAGQDPWIAEMPRPAVVDPGGEAVFEARPAQGQPGAVCRWSRDGRELDPADPRVTVVNDGVRSRLTIRGAGPMDVGAYRCAVATACGVTVSAAARLSLGSEWCRRADQDGDGSLDAGDAGAFAARFADGAPAADFNGDGFIDFFDYADLLAVLETGC